jgi:hypothetical protein
MKIPIILLSTKRKTDKESAKEFMKGWRNFLRVKKEVEKKEKRDFNLKTKKPTTREFVNSINRALKRRGVSESVRIRHSQSIDEYKLEFRPFQKKESLLAEKQDQREKKSSEKLSGPTESNFVNEMLKGKSFQIMGQKQPEEKPLQKERQSKEEKTRVLNRLSRENPRALEDWLEDSEQIPENGESVDEFIKRTNWTLKEENYWREANGLSLLKNEAEYRKLLEEEN